MNKAVIINTMSMYAPRRIIPKKPKYNVIEATKNSRYFEAGCFKKQSKPQKASIVGQFTMPNGE